MVSEVSLNLRLTLAIIEAEKVQIQTMATEQTNIREAIVQTVAEAVRVAVKVMVATRVENCTRHEGTQDVGPKISGPIIKQPTFNWEAEDKYSELKSFRLEVNNVFKSYNMPQTENIAIIKNWLGRKGLHFLETLTLTEQERCNTMEGIYHIRQ